MNQKTLWAILAVAVVAIGVGAVWYSVHPNTPVSTHELQVVAGENFWGSIAAQIAGSDAHVTAIVSDPNADPHDYEVTTDDARTFAAADYVILNGVGYDSWGDKLLSGNPNPNRKVLDIGNLVGKQNGDNPHLWYNPDYVNAAAKQMEIDMAALDPAHENEYEQNYQVLVQKLSVYQGQIADIKQKYGGTPVAATEDIFQYLATAAGLDLISPPAFTEAVAEGNDPPADSVATFEDQLKNKEVKVLVYNEQTVTPLTQNAEQLARDNGIPVVPITETLTPVNATFEDWMGNEIANLENALVGAPVTSS